ncbi:hypothetical protein G4B88_023308 [Cannabis sativa]|uniref:Agamous-like MADS-box protein AGL104 n=1 Tax=Cannabis sativa TaxID=3483 RepID=A0A7J6HZW2_CANSA|nr:hypothetical protein G4B88_023308 [Cannabis sativa]
MPDHDRGGVVRNKEFLLGTLKTLKMESDIALQIANPTAVNSNLEELQLETRNLQHQVQMVEQQLRIFEPDALSITSIEELESCENNLLDTLSRVTERKVYFEAQEGVPTSFENEVGNWLPNDSLQNPNQICVGSESSYVHPTPRPESSSIYEIPVPHGTNLNVDTCNVGGCPMGNETSEGLTSWHHNYTTTELLSALMSPSSLIPSPINKHGIATGLPPMMSQHPVETAPSCPQMQTTGVEEPNYENNPVGTTID